MDGARIESGESDRCGLGVAPLWHPVLILDGVALGALRGSMSSFCFSLDGIRCYDD